MSLNRPIAAIALVITATVAACGDDEEPTGLPTPGTTTSAPPEPTATPSTPASEPTETSSETDAELEALFLEYWKVVTDLWNDPRIEVEPMLDVATDTRAETMMSYISSELISNDARRVGEPKFSDITVTVDGAEAVIEACMDQSDWKLEAEGNEVPIDLSEVRPTVAIAVKQDDRWLIDETTIGAEEASIEC